tara:strand:+ start:396 stop:947 length:552 start_codon:yes stop_codon:yes gene_type:complete
MARTLSSGVISAIQSEGIQYAYLAEFGFSTPVYLTNHPKNLSFDSNTFVADGQLSFEDQKEETSNLEYSNITLTLENISDTMRTNLKAENYVGTEVTLNLAYLGSNELISTTYEVFKGKISSAALIEKEGQAFASIQVSSHWVDWQATKGRTFTVESQNSVYSTDRGLDYAHRTRENLEWGQS